MIKIYTNHLQAQNWLTKYQHKKPIFTCVLGFTETCLIPGISAAGLTPEDRLYTACADAELLLLGIQASPQVPLPPLIAGASPVFISRAILSQLNIPIIVFNAGLPTIPTIDLIDLKGSFARCLTTGKALELEMVKYLFNQGLLWGKKLAKTYLNNYLIISECVVGGTTTALSLLTGLGYEAIGLVNSSHPHCNHQQKADIVAKGIKELNVLFPKPTVMEIVASIGDPMQIFVAGMAIASSYKMGVLLAGGTQMLAIAALIEALSKQENKPYEKDNIIVGTTRWVAEDSTGDTVGLAKLINNVPLIATKLNFQGSRYAQLRCYEEGFVKEGVGAGGSAIAAFLSYNWGQDELLTAIEDLVGRWVDGK